MKEIIYKGKKVKVPFEDANYTLDGDKDVTIKKNRGCNRRDPATSKRRHERNEKSG